MSNPIDPINPKINSHNMLLNATRGYTYTIISIYIYVYIYIQSNQPQNWWRNPLRQFSWMGPTRNAV